MNYKQCTLMLIVIATAYSFTAYAADEKKSKTKKSGVFNHAEFSPDSSTVMAYNAAGVSVYNLTTRQRTGKITPPPLVDRPTLLYDLEQKKKVPFCNPPVDTDISDAHYTDAGRIALVATAQEWVDYFRARSYLSVWDITTNTPVQVTKPRWEATDNDLAGIEILKNIHSFTVAPKDKRYLISEGDFLVRRDHKGEDILVVLGKPKAIHYGLDGQVMAFIAEKDVLLFRQDLPPVYLDKQPSFFWAYHGRLLGSSNPQYVADTKRLKVITHDKKKVSVIDHPTLNTVQSLSYPSGKPIDGAIVSPTDNYIVTWSDKTAQRWKYLEKIRRYRLKKGAFRHISPITTASIASDGACAAFGHEDGSLGVWDLATLKSLSLASANKKPIKVVSWSPDNNYIMTHKEDGTVRVWQAALLKQKLVAMSEEKNS